MFDPLSDETIGYHLFFEPKGELFEELGALISTTAAEFNGPVFSPHVTLLARIPEDDELNIIAKAGALATQLQPLKLTLGELVTEQAYFRALYSQIVEQDDAKKYYLRAAEVFSMEANPVYVAHLSLLYGNYTEERKAPFKNSIKLPANASFLADKIHLYKTQGKTENWKKIQEFALAQ